MKRLMIFRLLCLWSVMLVGVSCTHDVTDELDADRSAPMIIDFGSTRNATVITRATLNDYTENHVYNIFVAVFNNAGKLLLVEYYDQSNQLGSRASVLSSSSKACWYVTNTSESGIKSQGALKLPVAQGTGYKIYALANLDADMINVSKDRLGADITVESDLQNFMATLNQNITSRNGYFPMSGKAPGVTVDASGYIKDASGNAVKLSLKRMDAKVRFVFQTGNTPDARGQVIKSFTPSAWRVVNVPKKTYVMSYADRGVTETEGRDATIQDSDFFTTEWSNFEDFPSLTQSGFSFYMMENQMVPVKTPTQYVDRDRQVKDATTGVNGAWEYANKYSTYVVVKGRVEMDLKNDDAGQVLGADVQYIVHLGDFKDNIADFSTRRNTSYTYTVTVNSVNNIRVEVETETTENQPGATGDVTIAKEEIALCDAHYVSKTLTFHAKNISQDLTWYVKTPFCDGQPQIINGEDVPVGLDYKWCHFRLNLKDAQGNYYQDKRRKYTPTVYDAKTNPDGEMDVIQLVKYMKEQKMLYDDPLLRETSDFDHTSDADGGAKISITVHVDEYYYDAHPITGETGPTLWKQFVNRSDRMLHILADSRISKDQESRATGSVITIQQRAIQSVFDNNISNSSFTTAWGVEHVDEYPDRWTYGSGITFGEWGAVSPSENRGNNEPYNGRLNSMREWGLVAPTSTSFISGKLWDTYMNTEVNNSTPELHDEYSYLRYSCMTRNRDNNGNGQIDQNEVRWYLASIRQLIGIWIGVDAIDHDGRLFNRSAAQLASSSEGVWRQHVISSTMYSGGTNSNNPTVVWCEEGSSTGDMGGSYLWTNYAVNTWSVRCVRNLGTQNEEKASGYNLTETPSDYVSVTSNADGSYTFTNTYLNRSSIRYYTSRELDYDDELSEQNRVYKKFEVASVASAITFGSCSFQTFNDNISAQTVNPYCPSGYRLPNQRELVLMLYYLPSSFWSGNIFTRTYYSMGVLATTSPYYNKTNRTGYGTSSGNLYLDQNNHGVTTARCVKDIYTAE